MNKGIKLAPFALAALMLVGCSSKPVGPTNGNDHIAGDNGTTYQEFYDNLYEMKGAEYAAKELIYKVAKDTVNNFETFKEYGYTDDSKKTLKIVDERRNEVLDGFYNSQYKKDGLFDEALLVEDLTNKGYKIVLPEDGVLFEETEDTASLVKYKGLGSDNLLKADYTDYLTKKADYDIYVQLLKEQYILTEKVNYFETKKIRKVQYFSFTPDSSSKAIEIKEVLEGALKDQDKMAFDAFETLATTTFQDKVTEVAMDKIAKDFAVINDKAESASHDSLEYKYKDEYIDLYDGNEHTDAQKTKVKDAWNTYTGNESYSKEHGYFLKKLDAINTLGYHESTVANDDTSSVAVEAEIDKKLFKADRDTIKDSNFLDFTDQGNKVFKSGSTYYVVRFEIIDEETKDAKLKIEGANALTKNSTNVKNAVATVLENNNINIYEEGLHTYLKDTYGFDTLKKK